MKKGDLNVHISSLQKCCGNILLKHFAPWSDGIETFLDKKIL